MTIQEIYVQYQLPANLQRHMLEVAAVGRYVVDHWKGPTIDKELITKALLLHDMANIIKFKPPFLGWPEEETQKWLKVQQEFVERYGRDHHQATETIIREINPKHVEKVIETYLCIGWHQGNKEPSWEGRICDFADCSVSPQGIVGFETRIADLLRRYNKTEDEGLRKSRENVKIIQEQVSVDLAELPNLEWEDELNSLKSYQI